MIAKQSPDEKIRRLATVVIDSNDAITLIDFNGNIRAWNRGAELIYGYSEAEALKMNIMRLVPPNLKDETRTMLKKLQKGENISSYETKRLTRDGRVLDIWLTITVLKDDRGRPNMIATTERDITERIRMVRQLKDALIELQNKTEQLQASTEELEVVNEELQSTNDELDQANQHLLDAGNEMINYSHVVVSALDRPLKKMDENIIAIKNTVSDDQSTLEHVNAILRDRNEIMSIINDLSMLLYTSRVEVRPSMVNLSDIVRSITNELRAREPGSKVKYTIPHGIIVYADKKLVEVAVRNILMNSWEHVHKNENGIMALYAKVFEGEKIIIFYDNRHNLDPTEFGCFSKPISGEKGLMDVDLRLMVAKKILDRLEGQFWVDYENNKGLNFCIILPTHPEILL